MDPRVEAVIALMRRDLRRKLTLQDMAQSVNLTTFHFCRLFKAESGGSPAKYLKRLRLRRAKEMLETTFFSVKEITAAVGFKDESHFVRDFKTAFGSTPQQYRARHSDSRRAVEGRARGTAKTANE